MKRAVLVDVAERYFALNPMVDNTFQTPNKVLSCKKGTDFTGNMVVNRYEFQVHNVVNAVFSVILIMQMYMFSA